MFVTAPPADAFNDRPPLEVPESIDTELVVTLFPTVIVLTPAALLPIVID